MTKARDLADFVSAGNPLADGTIDVADINGITATTAELNYTDGVTSNIQTQLDARLPLSGGTMTGNLNLGDSDKLQLGDSQDIQLYHDGGNSYFTGGLVGTFYIRGGGGVGGSVLAITDANSGDFFLKGTYGGATELYWNGQSATPKIATTSTGVEVNGNIAVTGTVDGRDIAADGTTLDGLTAAYQSYTDTAISNLVDTAPATLDTLNELAAALGDDANFSTTVTNSIATKVAKAGDTMTGDLSFGDNNKAIFGAGSDLQIYHNGSDSYIDEAGTGNLYIRANASTYIMDKNTSEVCANFASNGAVTLYYDNAIKLITASTGVNINGTITGDGLDMGDNDKILLGNGDDLQIYHDGSNSYITDVGSGDLYIRGSNNVQIEGANGENLAVFNENGAVNLYHDSVLKFSTASYGVLVAGSAVATTSTTSVSGSVTLDFNANQNFVLTMTGNVTLANPSTEKVGQSGFIVLIHSGAARTVSLGTDYETAGGAGLTLSGTSGATDIVPYIVAASGRILLGTPQLAFS